jgi:aldehyde dehydrogenase (NAD+)
MNYIQIG